jgi:hypothetical protein
MAPSSAALTRSRPDTRADVVASAAAVFGVLDLIEEIATASDTRDTVHRARKSAETALEQCGLSDAESFGADERGARPVPDGMANVRRGPGEFGRLLKLPPPRGTRPPD